MDRWLNALAGCEDYCHKNQYCLLTSIKYRENLVRHFIERTPQVYVIPREILYIESQMYYSDKFMKIKDPENIYDKNEDTGLKILLSYLKYEPKEYDILKIDKFIKHLLIKNSKGILRRYVISDMVGNRKTIGVLPISSLKLLKIFNIREGKDIEWLYPRIDIHSINDGKNDYRFYGGNIKLKKFRYDNIEHEMYVSGDI